MTATPETLFDEVTLAAGRAVIDACRLAEKDPSAQDLFEFAARLREQCVALSLLAKVRSDCAKLDAGHVSAEILQFRPRPHNPVSPSQPPAA